MSLWHYILRRLLFMVLVLFGVSLLVFCVLMLIPPSQRVAAFVKHEKITPEQIEELIDKYGLNDPAPVQYGRWLGHVFRGEFGYSTTAAAPVSEGFRQFFPVTLELVLLATPPIILFGVWLGTLAAVHKNKPLDHGIRLFAIVGYSLPTFWLGLLLLMLLYGVWGLFPPGVLSDAGRTFYFSERVRRYTGMVTLDALLNGHGRLFFDGLYHLILPALNLTVISSALIMRLMRSSMLEAMGQDYVLTAIAKGADRRTVNRVHARRNALLPVITVSGLMFASLLGGMVITETIFNRKGIGWWMARAASQLDAPAIMFNVLFLGAIFVLINLIVDILYAMVDPRVRLS